MRASNALCLRAKNPRVRDRHLKDEPGERLGTAFGVTAPERIGWAGEVLTLARAWKGSSLFFRGRNSSVV